MARTGNLAEALLIADLVLADHARFERLWQNEDPNVRVYRLPEAELHDLQERIESRKGLHQLEYMKTLGMGQGVYQLVAL